MPQTIKPVVQTIQGPKGEVELKMTPQGFTLVRPDVRFGYVKPVELDLAAIVELDLAAINLTECTPFRVHTRPRYEENFKLKKIGRHDDSYWDRQLTARIGSLADDNLVRLYAPSNSVITVNASPRVQINTEYKPAKPGKQSELNVVGVNGFTLDVAQMFAGVAFSLVYGITAFAFQKTERPTLEQLAKEAAAKAKTELCIDEAYKLFRGYLGLRQEAARMTLTERALVEYLKR